MPTTVCTRPEAASTPMCAFIPKCQSLPFFDWCISGSRLPSLFFVDGGAAIKRRVDDGPLAHHQALFGQVPVDRIEDLARQFLSLRAGGET